MLCLCKNGFVLTRLTDQGLAKCIAKPNVSAGMGLLYRHSAVRIEANVGLPLVSHTGAGHRLGFQFGIGLSFMWCAFVTCVLHIHMLHMLIIYDGNDKIRDSWSLSQCVHTALPETFQVPYMKITVYYDLQAVYGRAPKTVAWSYRMWDAIFNRRSVNQNMCGRKDIASLDPWVRGCAID